MISILLTIFAVFVLGSNSTTAHSTEQLSSKTSTSVEKSKTSANPSSTESKPLDFSDTGRPGQQTAGESRGNCSSMDEALQAVIPASHSGKTVSSHPSFWVYVPDSVTSANRVEFILQNEAREDIWRSQSSLNPTSGYQRFSLPQHLSPLKIGSWYRWYVKVYCGSQTASAQYVQGWIQRVPLSSGLYVALQDQQPQRHIYAYHGIWYDAVDSLLDLYQNQPSNLSLEQDWQNLLRAKGVKLENLPGVKSTYEAVK